MSWPYSSASHNGLYGQQGSSSQAAGSSNAAGSTSLQGRGTPTPTIARHGLPARPGSALAQHQQQQQAHASPAVLPQPNSFASSSSSAAPVPSTSAAGQASRYYAGQGAAPPYASAASSSSQRPQPQPHSLHNHARVPSYASSASTSAAVGGPNASPLVGAGPQTPTQRASATQAAGAPHSPTLGSSSRQHLAPSHAYSPRQQQQQLQQQAPSPLLQQLSPRQQARSPSSSHLGSSTGSQGASNSAAAAQTASEPDVFASLWPRVSAESLRSTDAKVELGKGWRVSWRRFVPAQPDQHAIAVRTVRRKQKRCSSSSSAAEKGREGSADAERQEQASMAGAAAAQRDDGDVSISSDEVEIVTSATGAAKASTSEQRDSGASHGKANHSPKIDDEEEEQARVVVDLDALASFDVRADPLERARRHVIARASELTTHSKDADALGRALMLVPHVSCVMPPPPPPPPPRQERSVASSPSSSKGKERETSATLPSRATAAEVPGEQAAPSEALERELWVFALSRGTPSSPKDPSMMDIDVDGQGQDSDDDDSFIVEAPSADAALNTLSFQGLTDAGRGEFTHQSLFPALYSSSSSTYVPPHCQPAYGFTHAVSIKLDTASLSPYTTFLRAARGVLLSRMTRDVAALQSVYPRTPVLLDHTSTFAIVPAPSRLQDMSPSSYLSAWTRPEATCVKLDLSAAHNGLMVTSRVSEDYLRPLNGASSVAADMPVRLLLAGLPATYLRPWHSSRKSASDELTLSWRDTLHALGVLSSTDVLGELARGSGDDAPWAVVRVNRAEVYGERAHCERPGTKTTDSPASDGEDEEGQDDENEDVELVWPTQYLLLDGSRRPTSQTPPTPVKPLEGERPTVSLDRARKLAPVSPLHREVAMTSAATATSRFRSASDFFATLEHSERVCKRPRLSESGSTTETLDEWVDPVQTRARQVGEMIDELNKERERKDKAEKEAAAAKAAPPPLQPQGKQLDGTSGPQNKFSPNAPLNIRTPLSIGASSTGAPSPAEMFASHGAAAAFGIDNGIGRATNDPYPTPEDTAKNANATSAAPAVADTGTLDFDQAMNGGQSSFLEFEWPSFNDLDTRGATFGEENIMGNLTEDDFSFFDGPSASSIVGAHMSAAPDLSTSMPVADAYVQPSAGPSPAFSDNLGALAMTPYPSAQTPFATATTPFPPSAPTPSMPLAAPTPNSPFIHLESPAPHWEHLTPAHEPSPHKTRYSPILELDENEPTDGLKLTQASHFGAPFRDETNASMLDEGLPNDAITLRSSMFDPVRFGGSHQDTDDKYDCLHGGKFGWREVLQLPGGRGPLRPRSKSTGSDRSAASWLASACDPRLTAASKLRRHQGAIMTRLRAALPSGRRARKTGLESLDNRKWLPADGIDRLSLGESDDESDDEAPSFRLLASRRPTEVDLQMSDATQGDAQQSSHPLSFGVALALFAPTVKAAPAKSPKALGRRTDPGYQNPREQAVNALMDQLIHNVAYRRQARAHLGLASQTMALGSSALSSASSPLAALATLPSAMRDVPSAMMQLRHHGLLMSMRTAALPYWRSTGFEPLAGSKNVSTFAVFEELTHDGEPIADNELSESIADWLGDSATMYKSLRLGHQTPVDHEETRRGVVKAPQGFFTGNDFDKAFFMKLRNKIVTAASGLANVVVFFVVPDHELARLALRPVSSLILAMRGLGKERLQDVPVTVMPVPLSQVIRPVSGSSLGPPMQRRLREGHAFSLYDKLTSQIAREHSVPSESFSGTTTIIRAQGRNMRGAIVPQLSDAREAPTVRPFQTPAFAIESSSSGNPEFALSWPAPSVEVLERGRFVHIVYNVLETAVAEDDDDDEWLSVVCVDDRGESWRHVSKVLGGASKNKDVSNRANRLATRVQGVWSLAKAFADMADIDWRIVIARDSVMARDEAEAWEALLMEQTRRSYRLRSVFVLCFELSPSSAGVYSSAAATATAPGGDQQKATLVDGDASYLSFSREDPQPLSDTLYSACSEYLIHVPRLTDMAVTTTVGEACSSGDDERGAISVIGVHLLSSFRGQLKESITPVTMPTVKEEMTRILTNYAHLSELGRARWHTDGRLPWPVEVARTMSLVAQEVEWPQ